MLFTNKVRRRHIQTGVMILGIEIFKLTYAKRSLGTEPGSIIGHVVFDEASNVRRFADLFTNDASGVLTHCNDAPARHSFAPEVIKAANFFPDKVWLGIQ